MVLGDRRRRSVIVKLVELAIALVVLLAPASALALTRASVSENVTGLVALSAKTRVRGFEQGATKNASACTPTSTQNASGKSECAGQDRVRVHHSNRQWSPELGAFLSPDEFAFHGARGTLWSWPGQNPIRHRDPSGRKPGDLYESLDMSAFFALDDYTALSQQYGVEVGGGLYKLGDSYFYSSPHVGDSTSIANLQDLLLKEAAGLPPGTELVGFYHTHPRAKGARSEMLSSEDVGLCGDLGGTGYVGTPEGLFGKFDARSSLSLDPGSRLPPFILPFQPQPHHQPVLKQIFLQTLSSM